MRYSFLMVWLSAALLWACGGSEPKAPVLSITPAGTQTVSGPTVITANQSTVTWSMTGAGSLSGTTGAQVVYQPPPIANVATPASATVTAAANGQTASVT
jgi:hypothetical protein